MGPKRVVTGQYVSRAKSVRAKELRRTPTPEEDLLWQHLRRGQLAGLHFRRQQPIAGFIADFYCHKAALVIEIDGPIHAGTQRYDTARDRIMEARGIGLMRIPAAQVSADLTAVLARIAETALERNNSP